MCYVMMWRGADMGGSCAALWLENALCNANECRAPECIGTTLHTRTQYVSGRETKALVADIRKKTAAVPENNGDRDSAAISTVPAYRSKSPAQTA
jgi:hypothetical protein